MMTYIDIFEKCKSSEGYFGQFRAQGDRYFTMPVMESIPGTVMKFNGKDHIMWSVNNYLGLSENEEIKEIARQTIAEWGLSGPMGSRMMSGNTRHHIELERQLADYVQKEDAILFNFGYLGVIGTIASMIEKDDIIVIDKLAHASIVDAAMSAVSDRKNIRVFRHNDMNSLENLLKRVNNIRKKGVLILTEGVYGMTGDIAKLDEICELKDRYEARLFVDDAHGIGVMGAHGRGAGEHFNVQDKIDLYFGTFAKAFASIGGFTAARKDAVEWMRYNARTQVFAKSLPMVYVKSLMKALDFIRNGHERRARLFEISTKLSTGLRDLGFFVGKVESPIVPVFVPQGDMSAAMNWVKHLRENGVFVTGVMYPVIPKGFIMFRMIPTASHTEEHVAKTISAFKSLKEDLKLDLSMNEDDMKKIYGDR